VIILKKMGNSLDKSVLKENFSVFSPDDFRSKLDNMVTLEQKNNLLQKYLKLYKIANGDYREPQNS